MEVHIGWDCHCTAPRWACSDCGGEGILESWLPAGDLHLIRRPYVILSSEPDQRAA
jgi:hypothetical protein